MSITINASQLAGLTRKLKTIDDFQKWGKAPMQKSVKIVQEQAQIEPKKAAGAFSRLATPGQRRAYWAKVKSGEAKHSESSGYIRSHKLKKGWKTKIS
jgi:hypothetical protein